MTLKCDEPLSTFAFTFNLRRHTEARAVLAARRRRNADARTARRQVQHHNSPGAIREVEKRLVGRCRLIVSKPVLKAPMIAALETVMINCFQRLLSKSTCAATAWKPPAWTTSSATSA